MKRIDLAVGMVVAVGTMNGAQSHIRKATVVKTTADRAAKYSWGQKQLLGGVQVAFASGNEIPDRNEIVALSQICGPWDEINKQVEEWRTAAIKASFDAEHARKLARETAEAAVAMLKGLGIEASVEFVGHYTYGTYKVVMSPAHAAMVASRLVVAK